VSEAAKRDLAVKRHWAVPGSRHDRLVRTTKFVLPILIAVSAIYALNLNILYGLGEGMNEDVLRYALPGTLAGVDLTIVLALANCLTLAWHAVLLRRESDSITAAQARATTRQPRSQPAW
jgi:hypothetical protein